MSGLEIEEIDESNIINFAYTMDEGEALRKMEKKAIEVLIENNNGRLTEIFYKNHIDLVVKNQGRMVTLINNAEFRKRPYIKWLSTYIELDNYMKGLRMHQEYQSDAISITSISPITSPTISPMTSPSIAQKSRMNLKMSTLFEKHPSESIFKQIKVDEFVKTCHRLYVSYYFLLETRMYQYVARRSEARLEGYTEEFKDYFNNFYRLMEYEIELYCKAGNFGLLVETFTQMTLKFLEIGNIPLGRVCIDLLERFKICKRKNIDEFKKSLKEIKEYTKYKYFVTPDAILRGFIQSNESGNKIRGFTKIFNSIMETKSNILRMEELPKRPDVDDLIVYVYLHPNEGIKQPLYTGKTDIDCIKQKCENR